MYQLFSKDYEKIFARIANNSVLNTACSFKATDYWKIRARISDQMEIDLREKFKPLFADITGF